MHPMKDLFFKTPPDTDWYRARLTGVMFAVIFAFLLLASRLFYLQVTEGAEYRRLSENNCIRVRNLAPPRGFIYDRTGVLLADNRPSFDLNIVPRDAAPLEETVEKLSRITEMPVSEIMAKIKNSTKIPGYAPLCLKQDITRDLVAQIEVRRFELPGVSVEFRHRRQYPAAHTFAHILGYVGEISPEDLKTGRWPNARGGDTVGKTGMERSLGEYLQGTPGGRQVEVDSRGQLIRILTTVDPIPGHNIYLTTDLRIQRAAEELLRGKVGALAAIEPETGKVMALVSSPSFDANLFIGGISRKNWDTLLSDPRRPLENKAVQGEYPPASTYKIITALAGLEEGIINAHTTFFCPGHLRFGDRVFRCWHRSGHGTVNVRTALAVSCDVFFYQVGIRLGVDRLGHYARAFGLGSPTGIELPHEAQGLVPTSAWKKKKTGQPWHKGENLSIAIGQGYNLTTPLQMAMVVAAIANNGIICRPTLVEKIVSPEGNIVKSFRPEVISSLPVNPAHLRTVQKGLWEVVNSARGTARIAKTEGIEIWGKTGTAQVISRKKGDLSRKKIFARHHKPHAWFAGFGKYEGRHIAAAVIVEHGEHGSGAAAPIVRDFIRAYFSDPLPSTPGTEEVQKQQ